MDESLYLPPGFRFHPTDEEIITHYLYNKIMDQNFSPVAIAEANFNDCEPWDLPSKAKMGEKEWFFFCQKDRKYPTGMRTNRATESGYWKATGKDKEIYKGKQVLVGMKKTLVFYIGRAPRGQKSNWVMHEYRFEGKQNHRFNNLYKSRQDEWVVYKVYNKLKESKLFQTQDLASNMNSFVDDFLVETPSLPYLMDSSLLNSSINKEMDEPRIKEEIMIAPLLIPDENLFALSGHVKIEQSSNSMASAEDCSALSVHQNIASLEMEDYVDDPSSSALQAMDFDCLLNYAFV